MEESVTLSSTRNQCKSSIIKANIYKNNGQLPENYNQHDWVMIEDFESYYIKERTLCYNDHN